MTEKKMEGRVSQRSDKGAILIAIICLVVLLPFSINFLLQVQYWRSEYLGLKFEHELLRAKYQTGPCGSETEIFVDVPDDGKPGVFVVLGETIAVEYRPGWRVQEKGNQLILQEKSADKWLFSHTITRCPQL